MKPDAGESNRAYAGERRESAAGERSKAEAMILDLAPEARKELWEGLARTIEEYINGVAALAFAARAEMSGTWP